MSGPLNASIHNPDRRVASTQIDQLERATLCLAARSVLENNTQHHTWKGEEFRFSVPSLERYPFQWFWDSCFHAIAWSHLDLDRAKDEIRSLLTAQGEDGRIPHIIYWDQSKLNLFPLSNHWTETKGRLSFMPAADKPRHSELIQPPVIAEAVLKICERDPDQQAFLDQVLPALNSYYSYLRGHRDPDCDHLISIVSPYESGIDACPAYDEVIGYKHRRTPPLPLMRFGQLFHNKLVHDYDPEAVLERGPFHVEDVLVNSLYAYNLIALAELNARYGNTELAVGWEREAHAVQTALILRCYNPERGAFFNLNGRDERNSEVLTVCGLMPLILPGLPHKIVSALVNHLIDPDEFGLKWPVPSMPRNGHRFSPDSSIPGEPWRGLWGGESWVNINRYLAMGARLHGFPQLAESITISTKEMVAKSGFRENYNPFSGEGGGAKGFGWSALVIDM